MDPLVALGITQPDNTPHAASVETNPTTLHTSNGVRAFSTLSVVFGMLLLAFLAELIAHAE